MTVIILPFGRFTEFMTNRLLIEGVKDTDSLKEKLFEQFPQLKSATFMLAVNRKLITVKSSLNENDEVAIMPPFSGG